MRITTRACTRILKPMPTASKYQPAAHQTPHTTHHTHHTPHTTLHTPHHTTPQHTKPKALTLAWVLSVGQITCMLYAWVFKEHLLQPMQITTHACSRLIKPMPFTSKCELKTSKIIQKLLKPTRQCTKNRRQAPRNTWILAPARPSDKDNDLHAPTQLRLARTHGTHGTHETKTKTKRSRSPGYGGRINRSNSPKPPIYIYICVCPCIPCTRMFVSILSEAGIRGPAQ